MTDAIFGIVVYGAAVISLFYFIVPFKWYLRIFKGKAYTDHYDKYVDHVMSEINRANSALYYLHKIHKMKFQSEEIQHMLNSANVKLERYKIHVNNTISHEELNAYENEVFAKYWSFKKDAYEKFTKLVAETKIKYTKDSSGGSP
jgi:predicted  nucleic acid-binding Zn-ribbon protein